jgi:hypothetical protein
MCESPVTLRARQVLPTLNLNGTIRLRGLSFAATDRRELVTDALEKPAQAFHELKLPLGQLGVLPKVLLTGRSLESLPPGSQPGSASRAPSGAPGYCSPRSSR